MSVTRMLILGAVRIFQPTHGYFVRRELGTWQVSDWAHINPGSIYNALRALTKEGMLFEEQGAPTTPGAKGGNRATYQLTVDGEQEFQRLVRVGLWELHPYEPAWLMASISFWGVLDREEVLAALDARAAALANRASGNRFAVKSLQETAAGTPDHIAESFFFQQGQVEAEREWALAAAARIKDGAWGFRGEDPAKLMPRAHPQRPVPKS